MSDSSYFLAINIRYRLTDEGKAVTKLLKQLKEVESAFE